MGWRILADAVVLFHALFIVFVVLGGLLVLRWPRVAWVHVPCAVWGVIVEWMGWICPLTPLELRFRQRAGEDGYAGGFIEHYVIPVLYPGELTRTHQWVLGALVLLLNVWTYTRVWRGTRSSARSASGGS